MPSEKEMTYCKYVGSAAIKRHYQLLPSWGEKYIVIRVRTLEFLVRWRRWHGATVVARRRLSNCLQMDRWRYYEEYE